MYIQVHANSSFLRLQSRTQCLNAKNKLFQSTAFDSLPCLRWALGVLLQRASARVQNRGLRPRGSGLFNPEHLGSSGRLGFEGLTTRASAFKDKVDIPSETLGILQPLLLGVRHSQCLPSKSNCSSLPRNRCKFG